MNALKCISKSYSIFVLLCIPERNCQIISKSYNRYYYSKYTKSTDSVNDLLATPQMRALRRPARPPDFVNRYLYSVVQLPGMSQVHMYYCNSYHKSGDMSIGIYT